MRKCIIITSYLEGKVKDLIKISTNDYIICADGGYNIAKEESIIPSIIIGDLDSINVDVFPNIPIKKVPKEKDFTDTFLAIEHGVEEGFNQIFILGGIGGRLDHTLANIQNLFAFAKTGVSIMLLDEKNIVTTLINGHTFFPYKENYKLSLFSFSQKCEGVTISDVLYPLENFTLENTFPIGVSNEFIKGKDAYVKVSLGELLIILSKD